MERTKEISEGTELRITLKNNDPFTLSCGVDEDSIIENDPIMLSCYTIKTNKGKEFIMIDSLMSVIVNYKKTYDVEECLLVVEGTGHDYDDATDIEGNPTEITVDDLKDIKSVEFDVMVKTRKKKLSFTLINLNLWVDGELLDLTNKTVLGFDKMKH